MVRHIRLPVAPEWKDRHTLVVQAAANGLCARRTAEANYLSVHTVKDYRREALALIGARNMAEAVAIAIRGGIIQ